MGFRIKYNLMTGDVLGFGACDFSAELKEGEGQAELLENRPTDFYNGYRQIQYLYKAGKLKKKKSADMPPIPKTLESRIEELEKKVEQLLKG